MFPNKYISKQVIVGCIFLSIFLIATVLIFNTPISVKSTYSLTTQTEDGVTISFNVFEPQPDLYEAHNGNAKKKAIIIGHGVMANKEIMKSYAIELAAAGFIAVAFDFRGHGQSSGVLERDNLINDVRAIKAYLASRDDVDINNLGYIGYSMGGFPGNQIVAEDTDFKCFIGVGTGLPTEDYYPEYAVNTTSGRRLNVLMIQARFDEAVSLERVKEGMALRLGLNAEDIDANKLYGSFEDGNASMIFLDDNTNHLLLAWDQDFAREARNWVISTFPDVRNPDDNFYVNIRIIILIVQLFGGLGLFFVIIKPLSNLILKKKEEELEKEAYKIELPDSSAKDLIIQTFVYSLILGFPGVLIFMPIAFFLPLGTAGQVLMLLFGQAFGILVFLWRNGEKVAMSLLDILKEPFKGRDHLFKQMGLGAILAIILYLILYFSFGLNYFAILPSITKILWIPIFFAIGFCIFIIFGIQFQVILQNKFTADLKGITQATILTFGLQLLYLATYLLVFSIFIFRSFFTFGVYVPIAIVTTLIASSVSVILYKKTGNISTGTIVVAFFIILEICTVSVL
ncbi:MAG: alpha/beta hydrolase [Candidatus Hermodarchaeota archaeon]